MIVNPILFYPIMLVVSVFAVAYSMGMGPIMIPMAKMQANTAFRMAGIPYQI